MSEAKFKVGELMSLPHHSHPLPIAEVVTCYRFVKDIGALWREEELTPYVKPLGVGDRVRHIPTGASGVIGAIRNLKAAVWVGGGWSDWCVTNCERIPTEAGQ
jgi:hypothetical protein